MRLPRSRVESACRIGAFALLGWLLGGSIIRTRVYRTVRVRDGSDVAERLADITRTTDAPAVHLVAPVAPSAWVADWLAALARSGTPVTWSGRPPAVAMAVEPTVDPLPTVRISIAAPSGAFVRVRDEASDIDSLREAGFGASILASSVVGGVSALAGGQTFSARRVDSVIVRPVLVVGRASWDGKFIVGALEEHGWSVEPRFGVAPNVVVSSGHLGALDTSRFAAAIVLDSTARPMAGELARFVRSGGGVIFVGDAARRGALANLAAGSVSPRTRPNIEMVDTIRLGTTGFHPVATLAPGALVLERRAGGVSMAARRIDAGRVLQIGYDDSWRWRMAGGPGSERAHREWWSRAVASVAYAPVRRVGGNVAATGESAPLAYLTDRLGPPRAEPPDRGGTADPRLVLAIMMILLLIEWTSRRLRGLR